MKKKYNISRRKIVESYMKVNTYANVAQKVSLISNNNNQPDKYRALIEKLVQLGPKNLPKF